MTTPNTAVATTVLEKEISYVPFGADPADPGAAIKLSVSIIKKFIAVKTRTDKECSDEQATKFLLLCRARKLNPFEGDAFLIGFDTNDGPQFSLVTAHQAFLKRAEVNMEFDGMESGVIVKDKDQILELQGDFYTSDQSLLGGWAKVHFKARKWPMYKKLRLDDFRKQHGVWKTNPGGMIVKCAESDALRSAFPTMMSGMYLREEIEAQIVPQTTLPPAQSRLLSPSPVPHPPFPPSPRPVEEPSTAAAPRRGRPPKAAPVVEAPKEPEPAAEPPYEPPPGDPNPELGDPLAAGTGTPPEPPAPVVESLPYNEEADPMDAITTIRRALVTHDLTEPQLMQWARDRQPPLANPKQTYVSHLAGNKLALICSEWPSIVKELQAPV